MNGAAAIVGVPETVFCRSKDILRVATRHDKPARNYAPAVALAAVIAV